MLGPGNILHREEPVVFDEGLTDGVAPSSYDGQVHLTFVH